MNITEVLKKKFLEFLQDNLKYELLDFNAALSDLEDSQMSGHTSYELGAWETKSGHVEEFTFSVVNHFILDGKEVDPAETDGDYDDVNTVLFCTSENEDNLNSQTINEEGNKNE